VLPRPARRALIELACLAMSAGLVFRAAVRSLEKLRSGESI
jgi:hypothetical protein